MATNILNLPTIQFNQNDKFFTHNQALFQLDAFTSVLSRSNGGPPVSPSEGDAYIVDSASGDWSTFTVNDIAYFYESGWRNTGPAQGPTVRVVDEDIFVGYDGTSWNVLATIAGINTQTGMTYTLSITDAFSAVRMNNAAANTLTIPPASTVNFALGTIIMVRQVGVGTTTVSPGAGVTINGSVSFSQNTTGYYQKVGADEWDAWS